MRSTAATALSLLANLEFYLTVIGEDSNTTRSSCLTAALMLALLLIWRARNIFSTLFFYLVSHSVSSFYRTTESFFSTFTLFLNSLRLAPRPKSLVEKELIPLTVYKLFPSRLINLGLFSLKLLLIGSSSSRLTLLIR